MKNLKLNLLEKKEMGEVRGGGMSEPPRPQCKLDPCMEMEPSWWNGVGMPPSARASSTNMATGNFAPSANER